MDWLKPALTDTYASFLQSLKDRDSESVALFEGVSSTNIPSNAKGWDATNFKFLKWNGSAWVDLATTYGINVATVGGASAGNASGNVALSNGTVCTNLNADMLDGAHAGTAANNVLKLDANGRALTANLPLSGATAGTYRSVTVNAQGQVTAGTNPTTKAGYGITDVPNNSGDTATGTWAISVSGNAATASACSGNAATATTWASSRTLSLSGRLRGTTSFNGGANFALDAGLNFGADTAGNGVANWNDNSNCVAGFAPSMLTGDTLNGPGPGSWHYAMNMGYSDYSGAGNTTQFAIPYSLTDGAGGSLYIRSRYNGTWSGWARFVTNLNIGLWAPTLTGGGASGTWAINVTGNAASASSCSGNAATASTASSLSSGATASTIVNSGNYRLVGTTSLEWDTHGGSIFMQDTTWIRFSHSGYFGSNILRTDGSLQVGGSGAAFNVTPGGTVTAAGSIKSQGLLLGNGGTRGYGKLTITSTSGTPSGGSDGDFVFVY